MGNRQFIVGVVNQKRLPVIPEPPAPEPVGPEMIMTWNTNNTSAGSSTSTQINLPLRGDEYWMDPLDPFAFGELIPASDYDFWVDWGDGNGWSDHITGNTDSKKLHTYASGGVKTVKVKGQFGSFYFANTGDRLKLTDISQFDNMIFDCAMFAFHGCSNLNFTATDAPILTLSKGTVSPMDGMFYYATTFNGDISAWNVSAATTTNWMFSQATSFNQNLNTWNVSNVYQMQSMFAYATIFNGEIGAWDVSNVVSMGAMFTGTAFNNGGSPSISGWTPSSVTNMSSMFYSSAFNQPIGSWNTSSVTRMTSMFGNTSAFNQDIGAWDVSNVHNMYQMFIASTAFNNGGSPSISGWTTTALDNYDDDDFGPSIAWVTGINSMFSGAVAFNQPVGSWDTSGLVYLRQVFWNTTNFNNGGSANISGWTTSNITDMYGVFGNAAKFNQNVSAWDVSSVTNLSNAFRSANDFNNGSLTNDSANPLTWTINTSAAVNMSEMFGYTQDFNQNVGSWDVSRVTTMYRMFGYKFNNGSSPSISGWTTSAVTTMSYMFSSAAFFAQDINAWDVRNVTTMYNMFWNNSGSPPWNFNGRIYDWQPLSLTSGSASGLAGFYNQPAIQAIPTVNYDQLLINWAALAGSLPSTITAGFGGSKYTGGGAAEVARDYLTGTKSWIISDGGTV